jgi:hypothetical protein
MTPITPMTPMTPITLGRAGVQAVVVPRTW